ncbi:MAG: hypothetical protein ACREU5_11065 [Burkholderiales bacterium]
MAASADTLSPNEMFEETGHGPRARLVREGARERGRRRSVWMPADLGLQSVDQIAGKIFWHDIRFIGWISIIYL